MVLARSKIHLNIDLGELPNEPLELYQWATTVNIACGGHAGDERSMYEAAEQALRFSCRLFAHPSYPDRVGFGRHPSALSPGQLQKSLEEQLRMLVRITQTVGIPLEGAKAHGALYHELTWDPTTAEVFAQAIDTVLGPKAYWVGSPRGALYELAHARGRAYLREGFADRRVGPDGRLVARGTPGALITDPIEASAQALHLADTNSVETICVHGDTTNCVEIARSVALALTARGSLAS